MEKLKKQSKKTFTGILGGVVLLVGIVAIPYPGPGWLIVFAGLGILATEFVWAKRLLDFARTKYDSWQNWLKEQPGWLRAGFWILTCIVVVATIWLLDGYGLMNRWLNLGQDWVNSPLAIFR